MESEFLYLSWLLKHLLYLDILPISKFYLPRNYLWIPRWLSSKESACQCRRRGFYLWVGKIPWSSKYQPIPVFLPGKSWTEEPGGLQSMGLQRIRHDWAHGEITYLYCTPAQLSLYLYVIIEAYLPLRKSLDILELSKFWNKSSSPTVHRK